MAYEERWEIDCIGLGGGGSQTFDFKTHPLPGQSTDQESLINEAKSNLTTLGLAKPPYTGIIFNVRLVGIGTV